MKVKFAVLTIFCLIVGLHACRHRTFDLTVETSKATVQGFWSADGLTRSYLGIPYAAPPVADLRFAAPSPVDEASDVIQANAYKPICYQTPVNARMSEDCLYLNVFTPKYHSCDSDGYPVMVWFHGGRYWTGETNQYSGNFLPKTEKVILITVAYRLNIFGFLHLDDLLAEEVANVGLLDQRLALRWIVRNVENFGGNPDKILIFGESAGAGSVLNHLIMPGGNKLFDTAVLQSTWQWRYPTTTQAVTGAKAFAATLGCTGTDADILACLRGKPAASIVPSTGNSNFFTPVVDGFLIRDQPLSLIKRGLFHKKVNIIMGVTQNEGYYMAYTRSGFIPPTSPANNYQKYSFAVNSALSPYFTALEVKSVFDYYNASAMALGPWYGLADVLGDYYIKCGSFLAAPHIAAHTRGDFHTFIFDYTSANYPQQYLYAAHGNELDFVFNATVYTPYTFTSDDVAMADRMMAAWANMASEDTPYAPGWTSYRGNAYVWNQPNTNSMRVFSKDTCGFWDPLLSPPSAFASSDDDSEDDNDEDD